MNILTYIINQEEPNRKAKRLSYKHAEAPDPSAYDGRYEAQLTEQPYEDAYSLEPLHRTVHDGSTNSLLSSHPTVRRRRAQIANSNRDLSAGHSVIFSSHLIFYDHQVNFPVPNSLVFITLLSSHPEAVCVLSFLVGTCGNPFSITIDFTGTSKNAIPHQRPPKDIGHFFGLHEKVKRDKNKMDWDTANRKWKQWAFKHPETAKEMPKPNREEVIGKFM